MHLWKKWEKLKRILVSNDGNCVTRAQIWQQSFVRHIWIRWIRKRPWLWTNWFSWSNITRRHLFKQMHCTIAHRLQMRDRLLPVLQSSCILRTNNNWNNKYSFEKKISINIFMKWLLSTPFQIYWTIVETENNVCLLIMVYNIQILSRHYTILQRSCEN